MHRFLLVGVLLATVCPPAGHAQGRAIALVVADSSSGKPLANAVVYVDRRMAGGPTVKDGKLTGDNAAAGDLVVVHRPGYVPKTVAVPEGSGGVDLGTVRLRPAKTPEDRAAVDAEDLRVRPYLAPFHERKASLKAGVFYSQEDIEVTGERHAAGVVRRMPGFRTACIVNSKDEWDCGPDTKRGTTYSGFRSGETECATAFWSNAGRLNGSAEEILIQDIAAIEAYAQPGSTPSQFSGGRCQTVVIWLKQKAP